VNSSMFCFVTIDVRAVSLFLMDILALSGIFCCRVDTIYIYLLHRSSFPSAELVTEQASKIAPSDTRSTSTLAACVYSTDPLNS